MSNPTLFIYPGSFCPPTYGHLEILKKVADVESFIYVVCSSNPEKNDNWFTEEECKQMWLAYDLPSNVEVKTFTEWSCLLKQKGFTADNIIMIRGVRNEDDLQQEMEVIKLNYNKYNLNKYMFIFADSEFTDISSSKATSTLSLPLSLRELLLKYLTSIQK